MSERYPSRFESVVKRLILMAALEDRNGPASKTRLSANTFAVVVLGSPSLRWCSGSTLYSRGRTGRQTDLSSQAITSANRVNSGIRGWNITKCTQKGHGVPHIFWAWRFQRANVIGTSGLPSPGFQPIGKALHGAPVVWIKAYEPGQRSLKSFEPLCQIMCPGSNPATSTCVGPESVRWAFFR